MQEASLPHDLSSTLRRIQTDRQKKIQNILNEREN